MPTTRPGDPASEPSASVSPWLSIGEIGDAIAAGDLDVRALVESTLQRIAALEPRLRAYATLWPDRARARARMLDGLSPEQRGPLHGVPIALKDLCDVAGEPTRAGTVALGEHPAAEDATVVRRLEEAGAVVLGKAKMTEGAFTTHHPSVLPPVNPWNAARWTGISSSGSGVAVAGGLCTAALGTDTGGSIRLPSSACGIVGLKPTHGRVSLAGVYPLATSLDHIGPMARSVDDVARLFAVLAGADERDPRTLREAPPSPAVTPGVRGIRVGFDPVYGEEGVDPDVSAAVARVLGELERGGAEPRKVSLPPIDAVLAAWMPICAAEVAGAHAETYPTRRDDYGEDLARLIDTGRALPGQAVADAWLHRIAYARQLEATFAGCDLLICPALAARFAAGVNLAAADAPEGAAAAMRFTLPFNLTGVPSLTLPCGLDADGAPIGVQLVGPALSEQRLLAVGAWLEASGVCRALHPDLALD